MSKTKHPAPKGAQRRAFEQIATGNESPIMHSRTRDTLLRDGLIVELESLVHFASGLKMVFRRFEVPPAVHMQWCQWCAENVAEDEG